MDRTRSRVVKQAIQLSEEGMSMSDIKTSSLELHKLCSSYNGRNIEYLVEKSIAMYNSLCEAMDKAAGPKWDAKALNEMTVIDLITVLGMNHIEFIYIREKEREEKINHKLKEVKEYVDDMVSEYKRQFKDDASNCLAAFAIDVYKEIREKLN